MVNAKNNTDFNTNHAFSSYQPQYVVVIRPENTIYGVFLWIRSRLMKPVLCPAELQADIINYSTLCKRCKHVDRIENGEATRIFRYIFQSACQNRKYGLQYLCYKRVSFASRLNSVSRYIENARPYGKRCALPNTSLGQRNIYEIKQTSIFYRGMAQFGSALDWGSRGHGFKSRYSDHKLR